MTMKKKVHRIEPLAITSDPAKIKEGMVKAAISLAKAQRIVIRDHSEGFIITPVEPSTKL